MKLIAPDYYPLFRCSAGACRHSCCVGWEIHIDEEALAGYRRVPGAFGERLAAGILQEEGSARFRLTPEERCPFLNQSGLCDIISTLGEDKLCQICADHPRFRNFYTGRTEIGLGLCCEAAARLILGARGKTALTVLEDDGATEELCPEEAAVLALRDRALSLLQDRSLPLETRAAQTLVLCGASLPEKSPAQWADFYLSLERLDPAWDQVLAGLKTARPAELALPEHGPWDAALEQLLVYFAYRHIGGAPDLDQVPERAAFAVQSYSLIRSLCALSLHKTGRFALDVLVETARLYSSEIEYSEENMEALFAVFRKNFMRG